MTNRTVATVISSRSDVIHSALSIEKLDKNFNHILIHDKLIDTETTRQLDTRDSNYKLEYETGLRNHSLLNLFENEKLFPEIVLLWGSSDIVTSSTELRKAGYNVCHVGAGKRSYNKTDSKEINRVVCDHTSNFHFAYHKSDGLKLVKENLPKDKIFIVGSAMAEISELVKKDILKTKTPLWYNRHIILDISNPHNLQDKKILKNIIIYANDCIAQYQKPVYMITHPAILDSITKFDLDTVRIDQIKPQPYVDYISKLSQAVFVISDSPTTQQESSLYNVPVVIPEDELAYPELTKIGNGKMINMSSIFHSSWNKSHEFVETTKLDPSWLGSEQTSDNIIDSLQIILNNVHF